MNSERYTRQTDLPEIGPEGQEKLARARVLVAGAGGLGSPLCLYLAAAGIGHIGVSDFDTVNESNLQRQILYTEGDIGKAKATIAAERIKQLNSFTDVQVYGRIAADNVEEIVSQYDIVADACDNIETRLLLNDACIALGKPYVYAAVRGFEAQVSVFGYGKEKRNYRELFDFSDNGSPEPPDRRVIGATPALAATIQCTGIITTICSYGTVLSGKLWICNLKDMQTSTIEF